MMRPPVAPRRLRLLALAAVGAFVVTACLGGDEPVVTPAPTPTPTRAATPIATETGLDAVDATAAPFTGATTAPTDGGVEPSSSAAAASPGGLATPGVTAAPRVADTLVVVAPSHPMRLLPPSSNPAERLLVDLLYDRLYRLDEEQRPVPSLARELPELSEDGKTWKIPIRGSGRFHDGLSITPEDVAFSLRMAQSPACSFDRALCAAVGGHMDTVVANNRNVEITLLEPHSPFLAEALARLPILSKSAVTTATDELLDAADRLGENRPDKVVDQIIDQLLREECAEDEQPQGCRLTDHLQDLERIIGRARMATTAKAPFTDDTGIFDEDGYAAELLERIAALGQVLTTAGADRRAAALSLVDITPESALGGGPFVIDRVEDGVFFLDAFADHAGGAPALEHVEIHVERNASEAVTRLLSGQADWILEVGGELTPVVADAPDVAAAPRPLTTQRGILFNVRPGHVYFDVQARRAFAACLDREALATQLDTERAVSTTPYAEATWATPEAQPWPYDPVAGDALLDGAGWQMATNGVRVKDGVRLSSTIAVRPSRVDVFTFANAAAQQLAECGIELIVEELDLTGDTMLTQLQWPNDFDTLLLSRPLGVDPDVAVRMFESSRVTTEDNQADANPSGFVSELADFHIDDARKAVDPVARAEDYAAVQEQLDVDIPYWPLWYDTSTAAISTRVSSPDGPIDPSRPRYDWDVADWTIGG